MPIKVLVNGAKGKMGREVVKTFRQDKDFLVVGATDKEDDLAAMIAKTDAKIVVDFTASSVGFQNASIIIGSGAHPVIGTTGFLPEQIEELTKRCAKKKLGGVIAPNFSLSAVLLMQFAEQAARYFPHVEIIEMHHQTKEESPSGTALLTAEFIAKGRQTVPAFKKTREIVAGARGATAHHVPIHSVRLPGFIAHEMVIFGGQGETLMLRQDSLSREAFMPGVKLACQKAMHLETLVYGLEQLL